MGTLIWRHVYVCSLRGRPLIEINQQCLLYHILLLNNTTVRFDEI